MIYNRGKQNRLKNITRNKDRNEKKNTKGSLILAVIKGPQFHREGKWESVLCPLSKLLSKRMCGNIL